jgi:hypothetical protein
MPPLASPGAYLIDRAIERGFLPPAELPAVGAVAVASGWSGLYAQRPREVAEALQNGRGPFAAHLNTLPGSATSPGPQLGALATACGASAGAYRMVDYPNA